MSLIGKGHYMPNGGNTFHGWVVYKSMFPPRTGLYLLFQ